MTQRQLIISPEAEADADDAAGWYELRRQDTGRRFLRALGLVLDRIAQNPLQFPIVDHDIRRALMRRFPYGVYFTLDDSTITVLAVVHLHRKPESCRRGN